jgi:photosystem II stability/assembly factor-like uncharacterized protein
LTTQIAPHENRFHSSKPDRSRLLAVLALAACLSWTFVWAAEAHFERLGPPGGSARSLLISTKNSKIVYSGTSDGQLFKSQDTGLSWNLLHPGIQRRQLVIDTMVEDPADPDHLFVGGWDLRSSGGGLFETRDTGQSWIQVKLPKENVAVRGMAISKKDPSHMIAGTGSGIYVSADGGKSWQTKGAGHEAFLQTESVAIDPEDPRFLFAGTWHLGFRSGDFGKTWIQNDKGMIFDSDVFSIVIDPRNPQNIFASACTGLYRSVDHGVSWTRLKVLPKSYLVRALVVHIDPTDSARIYGGTTEGLFASRDSGRTWNRITPADWVVQTIQVSPVDGRVILIGTEVHGILRSEDGGRNWKESNTGFMNRAITRIVPDSSVPGRFLVGEFSEGRIGGLYVFDSLRNGWVRPGAKETPGEGLLSLLALPGNRGRLAGTAHGVFLQRPGATEWKGLAGAIQKLTIYELAYDREKSWIFAGTNDGVYRARPDDLNFQKPPNFRVIPRVHALLVSHSVPGRIFAGTHMGILRSDDSGDTWNFSANGIPDSTITQCLVFSPSSENRIFAGTTAGLYESKNGGRSWAPIPDGRLGVDVPSVIFLDAEGARLLVADNTLGGVLFSGDGGAHWEKIAQPEYGAPIRSLVQDPSHPSVVYLGTGTEGVYRLTLKDRGAEFAIQ